MTVWLGFDPGGRETGVVLRSADDLLGWQVVARHDDRTIPDGDYTNAVARAAGKLLADAGLHTRSDGLAVAVEDVRYWPDQGKGHPCGTCRGYHQPQRQRNMTGVLGAAVVLGSVVARWPSAVVVPPGTSGETGHGRLHDVAYPTAIRPRSQSGKDKARHARSAWDVTHHAESLAKRDALIEQARPT